MTLAALVPVEWLALGFSLVAIALAGYALRSVTTAIRQIGAVTERQAETVGGLVAEADAIHSKITDEDG